MPIKSYLMRGHSLEPAYKRIKELEEEIESIKMELTDWKARYTTLKTAAEGLREAVRKVVYHEMSENIGTNTTLFGMSRELAQKALTTFDKSVEEKE